MKIELVCLWVCGCIWAAVVTVMLMVEPRVLTYVGGSSPSRLSCGCCLVHVVRSLHCAVSLVCFSRNALNPLLLPLAALGG